MKVTNWLMQQLVWSFLLELGASRTLPVPSQNYLKYCYPWIVTLDYVFQKQEHLKNLARSKHFYRLYLTRGIAGCYSSTLRLKNINSKHKLVHAGAPLVLLFLIGRLEDLTSYCLKLVEILLFSISCTGLSFQKTRTFWNIGKK